ncbi:hypothetical protein GCM10008171_01570 [Methylopila jiangsuensis]|uniref:Uncharacterized protein n=2 Tax=Methylopila jiangsuensis TaxID=586230 RepID=A0A9W6N1I0_9HYPH|nr:hypothetical protein [Methylopila jiangsuensis]GLK74904.1 hypothetical protein GCM10008171_01570 [Methylopila jiangsuensis]
MGKLVSLLAAAFRAVTSALIGSWVLVREAGKRILRWVPGAAQPPMPVAPTPVAEPEAEEVADGLKRWCRERLAGAEPRLPRGVTPEVARWAARLIADELALVSRASPSAISAHLGGGRQLGMVRPLLTVVESSEAERLAAREARKREMRAAIDRSAAADLRRRARWAELDGEAAEAPRLAI